jgi:hypothetical protein
MFVNLLRRQRARGQHACAVAFERRYSNWSSNAAGVYVYDVLHGPRSQEDCFANRRPSCRTKDVRDESQKRISLGGCQHRLVKPGYRRLDVPLIGSRDQIIELLRIVPAHDNPPYCQTPLFENAGNALDGKKWDGIYLGRRKGKELIYAGKVDHGFDSASVKDLQTRLKPLIRETQPYAKKIAHRGIWVEPSLLAEIEYRAKSAEGKVRHPFFKGIREDP